MAAAHSAGVMRLIDSEDLVPSSSSNDDSPMSRVAAVDSFSLVMYLAEIRNVFESTTQVSEVSVTLSPVRAQPQWPVATSPVRDRTSPVGSLSAQNSPSSATEKGSLFKSGINIRPTRDQSPAVQLKDTPTHSPLRVTHASVSSRNKATSSLLARLSASGAQGSEDLMQLLFREVECLEKERDDALQLAQTLSNVLADQAQSDNMGGRETDHVEFEETLKKVREEHKVKIEELEKELARLVTENAEQKRQLAEKDDEIWTLEREVKKETDLSAAP